MQTLNNIAESIFPTLSNEPFKLSVHYESKGWNSHIAIFDSVSDDNKDWAAFKRKYGKCHVTVLNIDYREFPDGKNRITLYLLMNDTMKIRAIKKQATSDK